MHPLRICRWEDIVLDVGEFEVPRNIYVVVRLRIDLWQRRQEKRGEDGSVERSNAENSVRSLDF